MARAPYPIDLTEAQWQKIRAVPRLAKNGRTGRARKYPLLEIWNAIFYQARSACSWRMVPHDFPSWTVSR